MNTNTSLSPVLLVGLFLVAIGSSVLAFAPWVGMGIDLVAMVLLFVSIVKDGKACAQCD